MQYNVQKRPKIDTSLKDSFLQISFQVIVSYFSKPSMSIGTKVTEKKNHLENRALFNSKLV